MSSRTGYAVVLVLTLVVAYFVTFIRFYLRSRFKNKFYWNLSDTVIIISLILQTCLSGIGLSFVYLPLGENPETVLKLFHAGTLLYICTISSIKLSICIFLLRLTQQLGHAYRLALCSLYVICVTSVGTILAELCQCIPMSTFWQGTCDSVKLAAVFWTGIALNLGTDILLISIPFPALLLITEKRIRIALSTVFSLTGIVVVVATIRAVLIAKDATKATNLIVVLSHIEIATGVIISALPELSGGFTRAYLQSSGIRSFETGIPTDQQRTQRTTSGAMFSTFDSKNNGSVNQGVEWSREGIDDIEAESADGKDDSSCEQSTSGFYSTTSTDRICSYPIEGRSSPNMTQVKQGKQASVETITVEMKAL